MKTGNDLHAIQVNRVCVSNALAVLRCNGIYDDKWANRMISCHNLLMDLEADLLRVLGEAGIEDNVKRMCDGKIQG